MAPATKRKRWDAIERRAQLLDVADEVFAERGFEVPLEEIIARSGLGRATLYRNFESRTALIHTLLDRNLTILENKAAEVGNDPEGFQKLLRTLLGQLVRSAGLTSINTQDAHTRDQMNARLVALAAKPMAAARAHSNIRQDLVPTDMLNIAMMLGGPLSHLALVDRQRGADRIFDLLWRGLHAGPEVRESLGAKGR